MTLVKWTLILAVVLGVQGCASLPPAAPEGTPLHDPVYVETAEILQQESFPVQVVLLVEGQLPDPCHEAVWTVTGPDPAGRIDIELHSEAAPGQACIQVLQPMTLRIPIGGLKRGRYSVWLNGEKAGALNR